MPARPPERERLAALMEERRLELDLTWEQVAEAADLHYETLRSARNENAGIRKMTKRAIDRGLQWTPGSVDLILNGGDPVALPVLHAVPEQPAPQLPDGDADAETADAAVRLLASYFEPLKRDAVLGIWALKLPVGDRLNLLKAHLGDNPVQEMRRPKNGHTG
jgi:hypothetical protein